MPMPLMYAHGLVRELARIRKRESIMPYLRPDSKSQVTVEYDSTGRTPKRIHTIVIATQHDAGRRTGPDQERHRNSPFAACDLMGV